MASEPVPGYYWVKFRGQWMIACFSVSPLLEYTGWRLFNVEGVFQSPFEEVGERIPDHAE